MPIIHTQRTRTVSKSDLGDRIHTTLVLSISFFPLPLRRGASSRFFFPLRTRAAIPCASCQSKFIGHTIVVRYPKHRCRCDPSNPCFPSPSRRQMECLFKMPYTITQVQKKKSHAEIGGRNLRSGSRWDTQKGPDGMHMMRSVQREMRRRRKRGFRHTARSSSQAEAVRRNHLARSISLHAAACPTTGCSFRPERTGRCRQRWGPRCTVSTEVAEAGRESGCHIPNWRRSWRGPGCGTRPNLGAGWRVWRDGCSGGPSHDGNSSR
jgi:hypothetical protein